MLSLNSIIRFEQGVVDPRVSTSLRIRRVFEREGLEFLSPSEDGEGVRVRKKATSKKVRQSRRGPGA